MLKFKLLNPSRVSNYSPLLFFTINFVYFSSLDREFFNKHQFFPIEFVAIMKLEVNSSITYQHIFNIFKANNFPLCAVSNFFFFSWANVLKSFLQKEITEKGDKSNKTKHSVCIVFIFLVSSTCITLTILFCE